MVIQFHLIMIKKTLFGFIILALVVIKSYSQTHTDLIVLDVKITNSSAHAYIMTATPITNRDAYDNQPNFINDKELVFSAADEQGSHDIIVYNFETEKFVNLSKTPHISEFSPTLTDCGLYVSAVALEEDGRQRLWLYPINFGEPELLYDDIDPVGYYDWYDNKAAMFILGDPNTLIYPYNKGDVITIDSNIGRSIKRKPKSSIITYIDKNNPKEENGKLSYPLLGFDLKKRTHHKYGHTLPGEEDFIWANKNILLMGSGDQIFYKKANADEWTLCGTIRLDAYQNISRMAYSPKMKKLVITMERVN